jgi:opacity protein-like surface antigen
VTCILGSGGGVVARIGRRSAGPWYFGGAYELSKQDPSNLYRFATLQQLRAEARWYLDTGRDIYPYVTAGSGVATYGDEWKIDTYGPVETLGIGVEAQVSRRTVVGLAVSYRFLVFNDYLTSGSTYASGASVVQIVGLDLFVEERAPIVRAPSHPSTTQTLTPTPTQ